VEGAEQVHSLEEEEVELVHYHHHDVMEEVAEPIVMGEEVGHAHDVMMAARGRGGLICGVWLICYRVVCALHLLSTTSAVLMPPIVTCYCFYFVEFVCNFVIYIYLNQRTI